MFSLHTALLICHGMTYHAKHLSCFFRSEESKYDVEICTFHLIKCTSLRSNVRYGSEHCDAVEVFIKTKVLKDPINMRHKGFSFLQNCRIKNY